MKERYLQLFEWRVAVGDTQESHWIKELTANVQPQSLFSSAQFRHLNA